MLQKADAVGRYVGLNPGRLFLQYEGLNPSRQLQRQRHDGGVHPRPHGRGVAGRPVPSTGNTSASPRHVLRRQPA